MDDATNSNTPGPTGLTKQPTSLGSLVAEEEAYLATIQDVFSPADRAFMLKAFRTRMLEVEQEERHGKRQKRARDRNVRDETMARTVNEKTNEVHKTKSYIYGAALDIVTKMDETSMGRLPHKYMEKILKKWPHLAHLNSVPGEVSPSKYLNRDKVGYKVKTLHADIMKQLK